VKVAAPGDGRAPLIVPHRDSLLEISLGLWDFHPMNVAKSMRHILVIVLRSVAVFVAIALPLLIGAALFFDHSNSEVVGVQKRFAQLPNVRLTYISDLTKQASQCITAYVHVDGKGQMGFNGLSTGSFGRSSHIRLHGIGPYCFRTRQLVKGQEGYGYDIDIGPASPIPAVKRLGITSVQSAITHYDDLLALVARWPVTTNEWPRDWPARNGEWAKPSEEEIHFGDLRTGDYYFCLKLAWESEGQMWPPNYPKGRK
jgi:hypothetical protein